MSPGFNYCDIYVDKHHFNLGLKLKKITHNFFLLIFSEELCTIVKKNLKKVIVF